MKNTIKPMLAILFVISMITQGKTQSKWTLDKAHSGVKFTVSHLVISEVEGSFKTFTGSITASKSDFTDAQIDFSVDVNSISTDNEMRDNHLKSDDFFNAEKYPSMTFKSLSFKKLSGKAYELTGNLTIRDVTRKVRFDVTYGGTVKDPYGNTKAGFKATATINRLDYGLKWNKLTEAGGAVVGSDVTIILNTEFAAEK
jgi:polyisoprenoid-binding protein YceI